MHVVADRPTIVSALPAPTSTCMRRKTHNACWRLSCNTEVRVLEQGGVEAEAESRSLHPALCLQEQNRCRQRQLVRVLGV